MEENMVSSDMKEEQASFFKRVSADAWTLSAAIILASLFIVATLAAPQKIGGQKAAAVPAAENAAPTPAAPKGEISIDNDPVLGDVKKAKVAIVEFSDFECPFCKKFHQDSYQKLVDKYVKSGQAVWVARDLPLPFHDPVATTYAGIANCVGKEKGNNAYFAFSTELYNNTQTNGKGLPAGKIETLLAAQGVNAAAAKTCAETEEVKKEIAADIEAASGIGIEGTPSFVVGVLDDKGNVTGEVVVGAQPLATFEKIIDKYLK
jgi:protein-disulfide isomerase